MIMQKTKLQICLSIFSVIFFSHIIYGQTIEGIVYDKDRKEPIQDAFIFVDDSSLGTITDKIGHFNLELKKHNNVTLVISHLNYENETYLIGKDILSCDTIFLTSTGHQLSEVNITYKVNKKLRRKRLKRFQNAFLGEESDRKGIKILNPEVILFTEESSTLLAKANEPILIQNDHLGYTIKYFLSEFELQRNNDVMYKGRSSFQEIEKTKKELAKIKRNRKKAFAQTYHSFFYDLIHNELDKEQFSIGSAQKNYHGQFVKHEPVPIDSILIEQSDDGNYVIEIDHHLTVEYLDKGPKKETQKSKLSHTFSSGLQKAHVEVNDDYISYLGSSSDKIILDKNGRILNSTEIEEYGFWATKRVAYMLPLDYKAKL